MPTNNPSESEIDRLTVAQADEDAAWDRPIRVRRARTSAYRLPPALAARVEFLAHLHRRPSVDEWLAQVIQERVELEEAAFAGVKRELAARDA